MEVSFLILWEYNESYHIIPSERGRKHGIRYLNVNDIVSIRDMSMDRCELIVKGLENTIVVSDTVFRLTQYMKTVNGYKRFTF